MRRKECSSIRVANIVVVHFSSFPLLNGSVEVISEAGLGVKNPIVPYPKLPETQYNGFKFSKEDTTPRSFKTGGSLPLRVKVDKISANNRARRDADIFEVELTLINLNKSDVVTILDIQSEWKLKGSSEWDKTSTLDSNCGNSFSLDPLQPFKLTLVAVILDEEKKR